MRILVQKFGGSSVADLECMKKVRAKVLAAHEEGYKVVVVLSARYGQTNSLLERAYQWSDEPDLAELDVLLTTGEQESVALFAMLLKDAGIKARSFLGFQIPLISDDAFGNARIDEIDAASLRKALETYDVLVVAGFQGRTRDMRLTTLGRGGSDTSAVALAAALGEGTLCDIYTDVDGVYTTDPRLCKDAHKVDRISYDEMLEMASMGAKVLQIRSVEIAEKYNVPVRVRSTFSNDPGTLLTKEDSMMESVLVSGIAFDKDQARVTLCDVRDRPGIAASIFSPLGEAGIVVDMIIQTASRDGVTDMAFTVSRKDLKRTLDTLGKANVECSHIESAQNISKVSVVGVGMRNHSGAAGRVFNALYKAGVNLIMISTSEVKISCLVDDADLELAVNVLHKEFNL
ncbi:aspartate kinase [uncultured Mailhella sp.]|uniref:aspartate kinase n=1 Tax=uncultured Mailhella sp. TaxID=1981031 RepID=UPI0026047E77|nr:aspartate kinase [uncultured Mailhella sp.]